MCEYVATLCQDYAQAKKRPRETVYRLRVNPFSDVIFVDMSRMHMWGSIFCLFVLFCSSPPLLIYPSDLWSFPTALLISKDSSTTAWFCAHRFGRFFNHRLVLCSPVRKILQPPPGFVLTGSEDFSTTVWFCAHRFGRFFNCRLVLCSPVLSDSRSPCNPQVCGHFRYRS